MISILVLVISILFQIAAAVLAVRLIPITGKHPAWGLIAAAIVLMAVRRSISLLEYFWPEMAKSPDIVAESVALIISVLMLIGIYRITPLFTEQKLVENGLREQERYAQSLLRLSRKLERAQTYDESLSAARDEVKTIIGYQDLWAYIFTDDKKYARMLVARGPIVEKLMSEKDEVLTLTIQGDRMLEEIVEAKDIVVVEDSHTDERTDKKIVARLGISTLVNVPIFLMEKHLGSMGTCTFDDVGVRVPTKSERNYLVALASHMAVTLDRIHLLTQRKLAEEALQESREMYQRIVDTTNEGIWAVNASGITNFINSRMAQMLGYQREEFIGKKIDSFVIDDDIPDHKKRMETQRQGIAEQYERRWRKKDGCAIWTIVSVTPILDQENNFGGSFSMITDITERKEAEEKLKKHREHLEELVRERTAELEKKNFELEKFNRLFVGRELRMVELKKIIAEHDKKILELEKEIIYLKK